MPPTLGKQLGLGVLPSPNSAVSGCNVHASQTVEKAGNPRTGVTSSVGNTHRISVPGTDGPTLLGAELTRLLMFTWRLSLSVLL